MDRKGIGTLGEKIALEYLKRRNYRVLATNYRAGRLGEIDLIVSKDGITCFIEVKSRTSKIFGTPAAAVSSRKQRTIRHVALCFLKEKGIADSPVRFDVIEVMLTRDGMLESLQHLASAF